MRLLGGIVAIAALAVLAVGQFIYYRPRVAEFNRIRADRQRREVELSAWKEKPLEIKLPPGLRVHDSGAETIRLFRGRTVTWNWCTSTSPSVLADNATGFLDEYFVTLDVSRTGNDATTEDSPGQRVAAVVTDVVTQIAEQSHQRMKPMCLDGGVQPFGALSARAIIEFEHGVTFIEAAWTHDGDDPTRVGDRIELAIVRHHSSVPVLAGPLGGPPQLVESCLRRLSRPTEP